MVQIIEERRKPRFSEQLMAGAGRAASEASTEIPRFFGEKLLAKQRERQESEENARIGELIGKDITGIHDRDARKEIIRASLKGGSAIQNAAPYFSALDTLKRMREIGEKGRLGRGAKFKAFFGRESAKDVGEYEQLGKSLIQHATNIPIRNRLEFETLAESLYDPTLPDQQRAGVLDAMERIISNSLAEQGFGPSMGQSSSPMQSRKERRPLSEFG